MKKITTFQLSYKEAASLLKKEIYSRSKNIKTFCAENGYTYNEVTNITSTRSKAKYPVLMKTMLSNFGYDIIDNSSSIFLSANRKEKNL